VLLDYFVTQSSSGLHRGLNVSVIGRLARCHWSEQNCRSKENQVILVHALVLLACNEKPDECALAGINAHPVNFCESRNEGARQPLATLG
jgi:hypothetical protein